MSLDQIKAAIANNAPKVPKAPTAINHGGANKTTETKQKTSLADITKSAKDTAGKAAKTASDVVKSLNDGINTINKNGDILGTISDIMKSSETGKSPDFSDAEKELKDIIKDSNMPKGIEDAFEEYMAAKRRQDAYKQIKEKYYTDKDAEDAEFNNVSNEDKKSIQTLVTGKKELDELKSEYTETMRKAGFSDEEIEENFKAIEEKYSEENPEYKEANEKFGKLQEEHDKYVDEKVEAWKEKNPAPGENATLEEKIEYQEKLQKYKYDLDNVYKDENPEFAYYQHISNLEKYKNIYNNIPKPTEKNPIETPDSGFHRTPKIVDIDPGFKVFPSNPEDIDPGFKVLPGDSKKLDPGFSRTPEELWRHLRTTNWDEINKQYEF